MTLMSVQADTNEFRFGTQSLRVSTGNTGSNAIYPSTDSVVVPGLVYTFSCYVKTAAALAASVTLQIAGGGTLTPVLFESAAVLDSTTYEDAVDGWTRMVLTFTAPEGVLFARPIAKYHGTTLGEIFWLDGIKFEPGALASTWAQNIVSKRLVLDQGAVQVDAVEGGLLRLRGSAGGTRDTISLGANGLVFGGDTSLSSPAAGTLAGPTLLDLTTSGVIVAKAPVVNVYLTAGSPHTWTKPAGIHHIVVECVGGGGAGGGAAGTVTAGHGALGGPGGGGGYARKVFTAADLASATTATCTTGAGGTVGAAGNNPGNTGGASTFAATGVTSVVGNGGTGGDGNGDSTADRFGGDPGTGGTGTGGDVNVSGQAGYIGMVLPAGARLQSGHGGNSMLGPGTGPTTRAAAGGGAGTVGAIYGGGGTGGNSLATAADRAGGAGGAGVVIVTEFFGP